MNGARYVVDRRRTTREDRCANDELASGFDIDDAWIQARTGIATRGVANDSGDPHRDVCRGRQ